MIFHPFEYYRPDSINEALDTFDQLTRDRRNPIYYGGGTEILTRARLNDGQFRAVIDLKGIPEIHHHPHDEDELRFGAGLRLTELADEDVWPLLTATADRIADHTTRGHITLGGNLLSTLPYKEALLPFLLTDSAVLQVATKKGVESRLLQDIYDQEVPLKPGEFLVSVTVDGHEARGMAFKSHKMTRQDWIDYPLVTVAVTKRPDGQIRAAFSGWTSYPFTSSRVNHILSESHRSPRIRSQEAVLHMPTKALDDLHGSSAYRAFVTRYTLEHILREWEDDPK